MRRGSKKSGDNSDQKNDPNTERPLKPYYYNNSPNKMRFQVHYQVWISAHVAKGTESILKKRSARLYRRSEALAFIA
ncbi:hypothetical protein AB4Z30_30105, partial [Paenibacillus sp. 2TAF8]|uniref:hypothetical protein n=1 Tax=Paenibacillus sp. 2TAF8 TaxID=3233020 RepID=UPI003F9E6622